MVISHNTSNLNQGQPSFTNYQKEKETEIVFELGISTWRVGSRVHIM